MGDQWKIWTEVEGHIEKTDEYLKDTEPEPWPGGVFDTEAEARAHITKMTSLPEVVSIITQALRHELNVRTGDGSMYGICECCGGGESGVAYHASCCASSRHALLVASTLNPKVKNWERPAKMNNPDYNFWVVLLSDDKIVTGWEFMSDAKDWMSGDMPTKVWLRKPVIMDLQDLENHGIDPNLNDYWTKGD